MSKETMCEKCKEVAAKVTERHFEGADFRVIGLTISDVIHSIPTTPGEDSIDGLKLERLVSKITDEQTAAAIKVLWSWDQEYEQAEHLLARLLQALIVTP